MRDLLGLLLALAVVLPASVCLAEPVKINDGTISYQVDHRFKTFSAVVQVSDAELLLDWDGVDPAGLRLAAKIPLGAFDSGNQLRDEHAAEALEVFLYPEATWIVEKVETVSSKPLVLRVSGPLSVKGVSKDLSVEIQVQLGETNRIQGEFEISLTEFGIPRPGLLGFRIADAVRVTVDLEAP